MVTTTGKVIESKEGTFIVTSRPPVPNLSEFVTVCWQDDRMRSPEQLRKTWALVGEIARWAGYTSAEKADINNDLKRQFLLESADDIQKAVIQRFSMGDVDMETASLYISWLIEFCVQHGVPTAEPLALQAEDVGKYVYACLMNKVCAVCRRKTDLHHVDRVGMGSNRDGIIHIGMEALPLCREHHMEAHQHGDKALMEKYHLQPVPIDEKIARVYKLKKA